MNKLKQLSKKKWFIVFVILLAIALVGGLGTYAMFYWRSTDNTKLTLKIGDIADVTFPNGQELNTNNLTPVFNYTDGEALTFSIKNKDTTNAYIMYTVNFNITNIDSALANTSLKYKLVSGNDNLAEGDFNNVSSNSTIKIARGKLPSGTSNYTLYIYIDSNVENDPNMMNKNIRGIIEVTAEEVSGFNLAQHITNLYTTNKDAEPVTNNEINYQYATSVGLMKDRLGGTSGVQDSGNIRYYGAEPNNWIDIGDKTEVEVTQGNWVSTLGPSVTTIDQCKSSIGITDESTPEQIAEVNSQIAAVTDYSTVDEFCNISTTPAGTPILWRIIGVFDGKLRIRRDEAINGYSFDTSASDVNSGWGINQWGASGTYEGADFMKLLNPGYETNQDLNNSNETITVNNSLWWNSESGTCYNGSNNSITSCDFTNTGLSDEAKEYVVDQTVYLGGFDTREVFANVAWVNERETNVFNNTKSCYGQSNCNDGLTRTLTWTGKVALIYPSDFGYAADFSDSNCQGTINNFSSCTANWMAKGYSWTVSPWAEFADVGMSVLHGNFYDYGSSYDFGGWPVLTLSSEALAETGTGSKSDPYIVS